MIMTDNTASAARAHTVELASATPAIVIFLNPLKCPAISDAASAMMSSVTEFESFGSIGPISLARNCFVLAVAAPLACIVWCTGNVLLYVALFVSGWSLWCIVGVGLVGIGLARQDRRLEPVQHRGGAYSREQQQARTHTDRHPDRDLGDAVALARDTGNQD